MCHECTGRQGGVGCFLGDGGVAMGKRGYGGKFLVALHAEMIMTAKPFINYTITLALDFIPSLLLLVMAFGPLSSIFHKFMERR